jgi:hypothetical protein
VYAVAYPEGTKRGKFDFCVPRRYLKVDVLNNKVIFYCF